MTNTVKSKILLAKKLKTISRSSQEVRKCYEKIKNYCIQTANQGEYELLYGGELPDPVYKHLINDGLSVNKTKEGWIITWRDA